MVDTIQQLQKAQTTNVKLFYINRGMEKMWSGMPNTTPSIEPHKPQESIIFQSKLILIKEIFQDINKQMLETNYTLNLGQLLKMALELKKYLCQKLKLDTQIVAKIVIEKIVPSKVPEVTTTIVAIDNHMAIIQIQIEKNIVEDVFARWKVWV